MLQSICSETLTTAYDFKRDLKFYLSHFKAKKKQKQKEF